MSASEVWASITESGVRSSCEASAVNSSCRILASSMGAATRRPMVSAPRKTAMSRMGPMMDSARMMFDSALLTLDSDSATTIRATLKRTNPP